MKLPVSTSSGEPHSELSTSRLGGYRVEPGETAREAALRETTEEAVLDVRITDEITHFTNADTGGRPICFHTVTFLGIVPGLRWRRWCSAQRSTMSIAGYCHPRRCGSTLCGMCGGPSRLSRPARTTEALTTRDSQHRICQLNTNCQLPQPN